MSREYEEYQEFLNDEFERKIESERQWMEYQTERFNRAEENYINSRIKKYDNDKR